MPLEGGCGPGVRRLACARPTLVPWRRLLSMASTLPPHPPAPPAQVDYTLRRLLLLTERIDATEDLVNISRDSKRWVGRQAGACALAQGVGGGSGLGWTASGGLGRQGHTRWPGRWVGHGVRGFVSVSLVSSWWVGGWILTVA